MKGSNKSRTQRAYILDQIHTDLSREQEASNSPETQMKAGKHVSGSDVHCKTHDDRSTRWMPCHRLYFMFMTFQVGDWFKIWRDKHAQRNNNNEIQAWSWMRFQTSKNTSMLISPNRNCAIKAGSSQMSEHRLHENNIWVSKHRTAAVLFHYLPSGDHATERMVRSWTYVICNEK